jgi:hypothetical protein
MLLGFLKVAAPMRGLSRGLNVNVAKQRRGSDQYNVHKSIDDTAGESGVDRNIMQEASKEFLG